MRIDGNNRVYSRAAASAASARGTGAAFAPDDSAAPTRQAAVGSAVPAAGIDALLALQAVDDATAGKRRALKRGHALLDTLAEIQADLAVGGVSEGRLNRAVSLITQARSKGGDAMDAVIADIELRVRVELAKLGRFPAFQD